MKNKALLGIFFFLTLITSTVFGYVPETSRQGSAPTFSTSCQGSNVSLSATTAGFLEVETKLASSMIITTKYHGRSLAMLKDGLGSTIALTNKGGNAVGRMNYDAWGNLKFPDKPGHGIAPCREFDLDDILDRLDGGRVFGFDHDGWWYGRHWSKTLTPYLYTGRRLDGFSNLYNNRNRMLNPRVGRFLSRDPIGFSGGLNLWGYVKNNPNRFTDPFGLAKIGDEISKRPGNWKTTPFYGPVKIREVNYSLPPLDGLNLSVDLGEKCYADEKKCQYGTWEIKTYIMTPPTTAGVNYDTKVSDFYLSGDKESFSIGQGCPKYFGMLVKAKCIRLELP